MGVQMSGGADEAEHDSNEAGEVGEARELLHVPKVDSTKEFIFDDIIINRLTEYYNKYIKLITKKTELENKLSNPPHIIDMGMHLMSPTTYKKYLNKELKKISTDLEILQNSIVKYLVKKYFDFNTEYKLILKELFSKYIIFETNMNAARKAEWSIEAYILEDIAQTITDDNQSNELFKYFNKLNTNIQRELDKFMKTHENSDIFEIGMTYDRDTPLMSIIIKTILNSYKKYKSPPMKKISPLDLMIKPPNTSHHL